MTKNREGLVAVKRVDRNGKLVTRHIKPQDSLSSTSKTIPAPRATQLRITAANRPSLINEVAGHTKDSDTLKRTLERATPETLKVLDEALSFYRAPSNDPIVEREKNAILSIVGGFARGSQTDDKMVYEMLTLRSAFCSKWSQENDAALSRSTMRMFIYGLNGGKEIPLTKPKFVEGVTAALRFAYELNARCPYADFLPTVEGTANAYGQYGRGTHPTYQYRETDTANFVFREADKVEELIELAVKHKTTDAKVLEYLLENDGASPAVSDGWL